MPPRYGKLDLAAWSKSAPAINGYKTEPWILKGARIVTLNMEIDDDPADERRYGPRCEPRQSRTGRRGCRDNW